MPDPQKPLPSNDTDAREFWESCRRHAMALQHCNACGAFRYPPRPLCPHCHATDADWQPVSGRGQVYVSLVVHQSRDPGWEAETPYNLSMIELEEGPRMWSNVLGCPPEDVRIGDAVVVQYDDVADQVALPRFRREEPGSTG